MKKSNRKSLVVFSLSGSILSLASLLIYMLIPTSNLANGIEYSGTDALWVLAASPIAAIVGGVLFMLTFVKNFDEWINTMSKPLVIGMTTLLGCMSLFNIALYCSYFFSQVELGFVAPYTGLIYDKLLTAAIVVTIHHFIFTAISIIAYKRSK